MTELMKKYEAETGKSARGELYSGSIKLCMPTNDYIAWLEAQLTWRPVSEKPEKEGWYLCKTQYADDTFGVETVFFNGKNFIYSRVIAWLPIPLVPDTLPDGWEEKK